MKKLTALLLLLCLLCGCSSGSTPGDDADTVTVYRLSPASDSGDLVQTESCTLSAGEHPDVETVLRLFLSPAQRNGLRAAVAESVSLVGHSVRGGLVTLDFSEEFSSLTPMEQSLAAYCAALTLCQLDEVDAVSITVGGEPVFQGLDPEDAVLQDADSDPYTRRLRLYFADETGRWLVREYHSLSLSDNTPLERYVLEELLRGPNDPTLRSALPAGTALLSCRTENGVCTVDLSAEFWENRPKTALGERLAVWSVVNSLTVLSDVDSVRILCAGQPVTTYVYRSLSEPLTAFKAAIGPASAAKGETELLLGVAMPDLTHTALLPCAVNAEEYGSLTEAAVAALYEAQEPQCPALFAGEAPAVTLTNGACTLDLSESFFAALTAEERMAAVHSLAATVLAAGEAKRVFFTVGESEALFEGVSYAGPWTARDILYTE